MNTKPNPIKILVADDNRMIRESLVDILGNQDNFQVIAQATNGNEAVELANRHNPDVVLMDVSMPQMDGIAATALIKKYQPQINVIALSMHDDDGYRNGMKTAGAAAYLTKEAASEELVRTIQAFGVDTSGGTD